VSQSRYKHKLLMSNLMRKILRMRTKTVLRIKVRTVSEASGAICELRLEGKSAFESSDWKHRLEKWRLRLERIVVRRFEGAKQFSRRFEKLYRILRDYRDIHCRLFRFISFLLIRLRMMVSCVEILLLFLCYRPKDIWLPNLPILLSWRRKQIDRPRKQWKRLDPSKKVSSISFHSLLWNGNVWTRNIFQKKLNHSILYSSSKNSSICQIFSFEKSRNRSLKRNIATISHCFISVMMFYSKLMD
jgi:hypothetical protein